ncbi:hypothetical protein [Zhaonella formicivorans]|uniref:hypothetical protein n=1 Tax=Zhaonella formicivorans TaxID=2528593 RepID=UPI0010F355FD|nr:hypothetical protein [Zhaonella formicivorans]
MSSEIIVGAIALALGVIIGSSYWDLKLKSLANWIKKTIPGSQLEPILGDMLIELGRELKNGEISAKQAFGKIKGMLKANTYIQRFHTPEK